jgi:hypothetical protein
MAVFLATEGYLLPPEMWALVPDPEKVPEGAVA